MDKSTAFILCFFSKIFQLFSFFLSFFPKFKKNLLSGLELCAFACHFFRSPLTITSGLLYSENTYLIKIPVFYPAFSSVLGAGND
jgi:hypothetical protein